MEFSFSINEKEKRPKHKINIHSMNEYLNRFSVHQINNSFYLLDLYSSHTQLFSIIEQNNKMIIQGWNYHNSSPSYNPFSPRSLKLSSEKILLQIFESEASIMHNNSCKIVNTTNGQRFILFKNKDGLLLHQYLDG